MSQASESDLPDLAQDPDLDRITRAALGRKAKGLVLLDVRDLTSVADAFLICSGQSNRQVSAIGDHMIGELKKEKIRPLSVEGLKEGHWVLIDYGHVVVHIFYEPVREFYDLEGLWIDAPRVVTPGMAAAAGAGAKR
jgi:ribosome-associated protein